MSEFVDYYEILEVHQSASQDVIAKAYKTLIFKNHPDRGGSEETAKRITGAYWVLSDPTRRAEYDREWQAAQAVGRESYDAHYIRLEDIPPEVVDALLAATFVEMAKATARTAGRVAGAVAVAGAKAAGGVVKDGAGAVWDAYADRVVAKEAEKERKLKAERDRQAAWNRELQAARDATNWTPAVSLMAKAAHQALAKSISAQEEFSQLDADGLIWLSLRHSERAVRRLAIERLRRTHMQSDILLAGQVDSLEAPAVLSGDLDDPSWINAVADGKYRACTTARLVHPDEFEAWKRDVARSVVQRRVTLALLAVGLVSVTAWYFAPRLGLAL